MATVSTIEWTDVTWNPVTGCTKVSQGCKHCYAERLATRFWGERPFTAVLEHADRLAQPTRWRKPRFVFVNSMSDLFHEAVSDAFIDRVFEVMHSCPEHTFQILTKRSERLRRWGLHRAWPSNVWVGVSIEDSDTLHRIDDLRCIPAAVRFLSCEPLIGPLGRLSLRGLDWVIVGGESGPGARPMQTAWVEQILAACRRASVPFFFKQWGGFRKGRAGRLLNGRKYDEMPDPKRAGRRYLDAVAS